jgi:pimeloyl-ACP methyl ester carboxylesterase
MSVPIVAGERRFALRHIELAAKTWGSIDLPPLLAVHGWLDNAASFDALAPLLADRHHVIAIDLAGHGRSGHRAAGSWYPYVDYLDELGELVAQIGAERIDLLGHSLGATLVAVHAAVAPHTLGRLLLVEGLGPIANDPATTLEQLQRAMAARAAFKPGGLRLFATLDEAIDARRRAGDLSADAARMIVERGTVAVPASEGGPGFRWSSDARLTLPGAQRFSEDQLEPVLAGIRARTLLVLAEPEAAYLPRAMIERRIACVPGIEVVRLAGTHHVHLERAARVAALMRDFLDSST